MCIRHNLYCTDHMKICKQYNVGYRKRPCISRTFFHKIEAQNQGCGLSTDTSVFGVLKHPN